MEVSACRAHSLVGCTWSQRKVFTRSQPPSFLPGAAAAVVTTDLIPRGLDGLAVLAECSSGHCDPGTAMSRDDKRTSERSCTIRTHSRRSEWQYRTSNFSDMVSKSSQSRFNTTAGWSQSCSNCNSGIGKRGLRIFVPGRADPLRAIGRRREGLTDWRPRLCCPAVSSLPTRRRHRGRAHRCVADASRAVTMRRGIEHGFGHNGLEGETRQADRYSGR